MKSEIPEKRLSRKVAPLDVLLQVHREMPKRPRKQALTLNRNVMNRP